MSRLVLAFVLLLPALAGAQIKADMVVPEDPLEAYTFYGGYMWKQFLAQGVPDADGVYQLQRGDFWGGRLVGGVGFGRLGFMARIDASGMKDQFDVNDPSTFKTIELFASSYYVVAAKKGMQIGPSLMVGSMTSIDGSDAVSSAWRGVGINAFGLGARVAGHGTDIQILGVYTRSYLSDDPKFRIALVAHVRLTKQLYGVGDLVTGDDGFIRAGIAVRAF